MQKGSEKKDVTKDALLLQSVLQCLWAQTHLIIVYLHQTTQASPHQMSTAATTEEGLVKQGHPSL